MAIDLNKTYQTTAVKSTHKEGYEHFGIHPLNLLFFMDIAQKKLYK